MVRTLLLGRHNIAGFRREKEQCSGEFIAEEPELEVVSMNDGVASVTEADLERVVLLKAKRFVVLAENYDDRADAGEESIA